MSRMRYQLTYVPADNALPVRSLSKKVIGSYDETIAACADLLRCYVCVC